MSRTLYDRATHHAGALLWSGAEANPSYAEHFKNDMCLEMVRGLTMRSATFEPAKIGHYSTIEVGGVHGNGFRTGALPGPAWMDITQWGHTKAGIFKIRTAGNSPTQQIDVVGPRCFEVHADKDLKFYFRGSIPSVITEVDTFLGMATDQTTTGWPGVVDRFGGSDGLVAVDAIGFLKPDGGSSTANMTFVVRENSVQTNSAHTVTFPAVIASNTEFECGFHVHGDTSITVFMKVGLLETVTRLVRVAGTTIDKLNTNMAWLCPVVSAVAATSVKQGVDIKAFGCTQPI